MKHRISFLCIWLLLARAANAYYFYGGLINDLGQNAETLPAWSVTLQNVLNAGNIPLAAINETKANESKAVMEEFGPPIAMAFRLAPGPEQDALLEKTLTALKAERLKQPDQELVIAALERQLAMLQRQRVFQARVEEYSKKSASPMTFADRISLQAELNMFNAQIALDAQAAKAADDAALLDAKVRANQVREKLSALQAVEAKLGK